MKKLAVMAVLAIAACSASPAQASKATAKSTFEVVAGEGMSGTGQIVETRAKKAAPWYSLSMKLTGVQDADENGPIEYCLSSYAAEGIVEVDRSFAQDGTVKVDYGTHTAPVIIVVTRCGGSTWLALGGGFVLPGA